MIIPHLTQFNSPSLSKYNTGLGNALFQIFTSYGLSKKYNKMFNNINLKILIDKLENNFNLNHKNTIYRNLQIYNTISHKNSIKIYENTELYSSLDSNIIQTIKNNNNCNIFLFGYFQSHKYFDEYYDELCELIKPDLNSYNYIKLNYSHLFDKNIINISIHVRLNWGYGICYNSEYIFYYDAINYIKKKYNNQYKFIINIFSDNILELKKKFKCNDECIYYMNNPDYIDLWCMSLCNHNVLSNSTLSWWGAYINKTHDKCVIYPLDILRLHGSTIYNTPKHIERKGEHYKIDWIGLNTPNVIYFAP